MVFGETLFLWNGEAKQLVSNAKVNVYTVIIRETSRNEVSTLVDMLRRSFAGVAERFNLTIENCPKNLAFCTEQRIQDDLKRGLKYYILEEHGLPCACVALEKAGSDVCYLERLAVLPEHRKKGYGKALVNHIFDEAKKIGIGRVEIGTISQDIELMNWYKKFGFLEKNTKKFDHLPFIVAYMFVEL